MILYLSKIRDVLNKKPFDIDTMHGYVCLNPKYANVTLENPNTKILMDSGAFQDTEGNKRVSFQEALDRQLKLEAAVGVQIERIVSYDFIGNVKETVEANRFLAEKRDELYPRQLVLMIQGMNADEYLDCLKQTLEIAKPGDCIGFGGIALAGRLKAMREKLYETLSKGLGYVSEKGIKDIHLFGVGTFEVLKQAKRLCKGYDINLSCDTSSVEVRSIMGNVINMEQEKWIKTYSREDKYVNYHPCDLTKDNIIKAVKIVGGI